MSSPTQSVIPGGSLPSQLKCDKNINKLVNDTLPSIMTAMDGLAAMLAMGLGTEKVKFAFTFVK